MTALLRRYSDGHFTLTNQMGSSASFTFNGSAIYIFGAKRCVVRIVQTYLVLTFA